MSVILYLQGSFLPYMILVPKSTSTDSHYKPWSALLQKFTRPSTPQQVQWNRSMSTFTDIKALFLELEWRLQNTSILFRASKYETATFFWLRTQSQVRVNLWEKTNSSNRYQKHQCVLKCTVKVNFPFELTRWMFSQVQSGLRTSSH